MVSRILSYFRNPPEAPPSAPTHALNTPDVFEARGTTQSFPNYFLNIPPEKIYDAMHSILTRLKIPYIDPATGRPENQGFFRLLESQIKQKDPGAKVYISGGVVRSLLGYIYRKMHAEYLKRGHQGVTAGQVLDRLIQGEPRRKNPTEVPGESSSDDDLTGEGANIEIPTLSALGIGSDLDILVEFSDGFTGDRKHVLDSASQTINSFSKSVGLDSQFDALRRTLTPLGDVKEYGPQIERSVAQGGSSLDWLAYPLSGGTMREPEGFPHIMSNFFNGQVDYLPESTKDIRTDSQGTTIRGLRPLMELPFLNLTERGNAQLLKELQALRGQTLSPKALEQFAKMVRNARFAGAGNRFSIPKGDFEKVVNEISRQGPRTEKGIPLIPEFTRYEKIEGREVKNHSIDRDLMPLDEFLSKHTDNGILYHGTPQIEHMFAMIRNGLVMSISDKQGKADFGSGTYTAPKKETSSAYIGSQGVVLELPVIRSESLRILDYAKFQQTSLGQKALQEAQKSQENINQYLAKKYDLDIIFNSYPILMNSAAVRVPKKVEDVLRAKLGMPVTLSDFLLFDEKKRVEHRALVRLGKLMNSNLDHTFDGELKNHLPELRQLVEENSDPNVCIAALKELGTLAPLDPETQSLAIKCLNIPNEGLQLQALAFFSNNPSEDELSREAIGWHIFPLLENSNPAVSCAAINALGVIRPKNSLIYNKICKFLKADRTPKQKIAAIKTLARIPEKASEFRAELLDCLNDRNMDVLQIAIFNLSYFMKTDASIFLKSISRMVLSEENHHSIPGIFQILIRDNISTDDFVSYFKEHKDERVMSFLFRDPYGVLQEHIKAALRSSVLRLTALKALEGSWDSVGRNLKTITDFLHEEDSAGVGQQAYHLLKKAEPIFFVEESRKLIKLELELYEAKHPIRTFFSSFFSRSKPPI